MKRLLITLGLAAAVAVAWAATETGDFHRGIDLTGKTNVTGAQLVQLVNAATPGTNKGMVIRRSTRPDVTNNPRQTNFLWVDISTSTPSVKFYAFCCGDSDTNWVSASVGAGAVTSGSIADGAVIAGKLAANSVFTTNIVNNAIDANKLAALSINNSHIQSGAVSNANIADRTITGAKIALATITHTNIGDGEITEGKLADSSVASNKLAAGSVNISKISTGSTSNQFLMTGATDSNPAWRSYITKYESGTVAVPSAETIYTNTHGLGGLPTLIRWVLVNQTTDLGYPVGDEVDINGVINGLSNPITSQSANATTLYLSAAGNSPWYLRERDADVTNAITKASWVIKGYAVRIGN